MTKIVNYVEIKRAGLAVDICQRLGFDARGRPLVPDGIEGPLTRGATYLWPHGHCGAVSVAMAEVLAGAREIGGNNQGPWVERYAGKKRLGDAWCAHFAGYALSMAHPGAPRSGGAKRLGRLVAEQGRRIERPSQLLPGDLIVWDRGRFAWQGHVGVVAWVEGGHVYSIEGNSGATGAVRVFRYELPDAKRGRHTFDFGARYGGQ